MYDVQRVLRSDRGKRGMKNIWKRRHERSKTLLHLNVESLHVPEKTGRAVILDISESGAAFCTNLEFDIGEELIMRFRLSRNRIFVIHAQVRRFQYAPDCNTYGSEFINVNILNRNKLKKIVEEVKKENDFQ